MIRQVVPALVFAMFVTGAFAALAVSHVLGAPAPEPSRLTPETVAAIARDWLRDRVGRDIDHGSIELVAPPREIALPAGEVTTAVSLQSGVLTGGPVTVLVEAVSRDRLGLRAARSTTVVFRINAQHDVAVATRELLSHTVVTAADVRVERRPYDRVPPGALHDARDAIGKEVTRSVAPSEPLTAATVAAPRAVRRGGVVTLLVEGQGFRIVAKGIASEDGAIGDTIRVVNQASRREMAGRVEDDRTVRIPF
jgi:flagella basal body P-ring formation protein FlgA